MKDINDWKIVPLADLEVQGVVGWSDFQHSCAKVFLHRRISKDGDFSRL